MRESGVDTHPLNTLHGQQLFVHRSTGNTLIYFNTIDNMTGIIYINDCIFVDCRIVTTAIRIYDGTANNLQIGLVDIRFVKTRRTGGNRLFTVVEGSLRLIDMMVVVSYILIEIFTIATTKELTKINSLVASIFPAADTNIGIPSVVDTIISCLCQC